MALSVAYGTRGPMRQLSLREAFAADRPAGRTPPPPVPARRFAARDGGEAATSGTQAAAAIAAQRVARLHLHHHDRLPERARRHPVLHLPRADHRDVPVPVQAGGARRLPAEERPRLEKAALHHLPRPDRQPEGAPPAPLLRSADGPAVPLRASSSASPACRPRCRWPRPLRSRTSKPFTACSFAASAASWRRSGPRSCSRGCWNDGTSRWCAPTSTT